MTSHTIHGFFSLFFMNSLLYEYLFTYFHFLARSWCTVKNACRFICSCRINTQGIHCVFCTLPYSKDPDNTENIVHLGNNPFVFFCRCVSLIVYVFLLYSLVFWKKDSESLRVSFLLLEKENLLPVLLSYSNSSSIFQIVMVKVLFNNAWKMNTPFNHPLYPVKCEPIPECTGQKVDYVIDKPPVYHNRNKKKYSTSILMDNSKCPVQLTCMSLDFWRKLCTRADMWRANTVLLWGDSADHWGTVSPENQQ